MVNITNKDIYMTKGDTVRLQLNIYDKDGDTYVIQPDDEIKMAVRHPHKTKDEFSITTKDNNIIIDKDMTKDMIVGVYEYDIQITFGNGEVNTIVPLHKFVVQKEVS